MAEKYIDFRIRRSRSWLDATYGKLLSYEMGERLCERCAGHACVKLELTYDRTPYGHPSDLYEKASADRHVRSFIAKLSRYMGESLNGRWICKMEFQNGGWVHWHLILVDCDFLDQKDLTTLWGRGHVWIRRAREAELRYVCKYICKEGQVPDYLYIRPIRSVKIFRASPGFWGPLEHREGDTPPRPLRFPIYVTVGEMIERGSETVLVRDQEGLFRQVRGDPWLILNALRRAGAYVIGGEDGWLRLAGVSRDDLEQAANAVARAARTHGLSGCAGLAGTAGLHLINSGNPPMRLWIKRVIDYELGWRDSAECPWGLESRDISQESAA